MAKAKKSTDEGQDSGAPEQQLQKLHCFESRQAGLQVAHGNGWLRFSNHTFNTTDPEVVKKLKATDGVRLIEIRTVDEDGNVVDEPVKTTATKPWVVKPVEAGSEYDLPSAHRSFAKESEAKAFVAGELGDDGTNYEIVYRGE